MFGYAVGRPMPAGRPPKSKGRAETGLGRDVIRIMRDKHPVYKDRTRPSNPAPGDTYSGRDTREPTANIALRNSDSIRRRRFSTTRFPGEDRVGIDCAHHGISKYPVPAVEPSTSIVQGNPVAHPRPILIRDDLTGLGDLPTSRRPRPARRPCRHG